MVPCTDDAHLYCIGSLFRTFLNRDLNSHSKPRSQANREEPGNKVEPFLPVIRTDNVYLYLLNSKYSRINSLINMFSFERLGLSSFCIVKTDILFHCQLQAVIYITIYY
jgi:hypothetical protein